MRLLALGSVTLLVLLTSGCGNSDDRIARPAATPATSPTAPTSSSTPPTPQSMVAPATGPEISGPVVSLRAPADFDKRSSPDENGGRVGAKDPRSGVNLDDSEKYLDDTPDSMARRSIKASSYDPPLVRQPDVTIAGVPAYHLSGADPAFDGWTDEYGFPTATRLVKITIDAPSELSKADRDAIAASVLASVTIED